MGAALSMTGLSVGVSEASSTQVTDIDIAQTYGGQCNFGCVQNVAGSEFVLEGVTVSGNTIANKMACVVDANCMMNNTIASTVDLLNKASNFAASDKGGSRGVLADITGAEINYSNTNSYQHNMVRLRNAITQKCDMTSSQMVNDTIFGAKNSTFLGDLTLNDMAGSVEGSCALQSSMSGAAAVTNLAENRSTSGQAGTIPLWMIIAAIIGICVLVGVLGYSRKGQQPTPGMPLSMIPMMGSIPPYGRSLTQQLSSAAPMLGGAVALPGMGQPGSAVLPTTVPMPAPGSATIAR